MDQTPKLRNYQRYVQAAWNRPDYYPVAQQLDPARYRPTGEWIGRLILPQHQQRRAVNGCLFEVLHAPDGRRDLLGQVVRLRFSGEREVQARAWAVTRDVLFQEPARKGLADGLVLPERLNTWRLVNPLESLAGARPTDDVVVRLPGPVSVQEGDGADAAPILLIGHDPVQIGGRFYALVSFVGPAQPRSDRFRVRHFDRATGAFDGAEEIVHMPAPVLDENGVAPSTSDGIERSPLNAVGWYIYGAQNHDGVFVVQALASRALLRLKPDRVVLGEDAAWQYIRHESWHDPVAQKGRVSSVLCSQDGTTPEQALATWNEGDRALMLHVYAGIGGNKREPSARTGLYFGHFAFGIAAVVREPLAGDLVFDIVYHQVYTQNVDGLIAGALHWSRYLGDRQFGWAGVRPICDIMVKHEPLSDVYDVDGCGRSALGEVASNLEQMTARYRIGDGNGVTYVGPANNCAQDSAQALYTALRSIQQLIASAPGALDRMQREQPAQYTRLEQVMRLVPALRQRLVGRRGERADWQHQIATLGLSESYIRSFAKGLATWRTLLPRKASDTVVRELLRQGASAWVLRASQIGGHDPDIEPIPPMTF
ncbi:MAG TPA: hypothetical protein VF897_05635 [Roseiflexaceae bacterium]